MIVAEALSWEGTPFHHQESTKGVGCDCKGLVYGVARSLGLDLVAGYRHDVKDYARSVDGKRMRRLLDKYLVPKPKQQALPGNVVWLSFLMFPQHLGILMPHNELIHASDPDGRVVRHSLSKAWQDRICAVYTYKGVVDG